MNHDPSLQYGNIRRMQRAVAPLLASVMLSGCIPTGQRPELTDETYPPTETAISADSSDAMNPAERGEQAEVLSEETTFDAYFTNIERLNVLQTEVDKLVGLAATLSENMGRFDTQISTNKLGDEQVDILGKNAQGDFLHISITGEASDTDYLFHGVDSSVAIQPKDFSITVVPEEAGDNFYNYSADVGFHLVPSEDAAAVYETVLRVAAPEAPESVGLRGKYYTVGENGVDVLIIDHEDPTSAEGVSSYNAETAQLVDTFAILRATQLLSSVNYEGPVDVYDYGDEVEATLMKRRNPEGTSLTDEDDSESSNEENIPVVTGTVPHPKIVDGTLVVPTTTDAQENLVDETSQTTIPQKRMSKNEKYEHTPDTGSLPGSL